MLSDQATILYQKMQCLTLNPTMRSSKVVVNFIYKIYMVSNGSLRLLFLNDFKSGDHIIPVDVIKYAESNDTWEFLMNTFERFQIKRWFYTSWYSVKVDILFYVESNYLRINLSQILFTKVIIFQTRVEWKKYSKKCNLYQECSFLGQTESCVGSKVENFT